MRASRSILLLGFVAVAGAGCREAVPGFVCHANAACDPGGLCIDTSCARLDPMCPSGYRWSDSAGDRAGQCAVFPDINMDAPDPNCGNGRLDPGEACDDTAGVPCPTPEACDDGEPCSTDEVSGTACQRHCVYSFAMNGVKCGFGDGGAVGACHARACCTGCLTDMGCVGGTAPGQCGAGGGACGDCLAALADCRAAMCAGGGCGSAPLPDGVPCPKTDGGTCFGGSCCSGCMNAQGQCVAGSAASACGSGGGKCIDCGARACARPDGGAGYRCANCSPSCMNKACGDDGCGGSCGACPANKTCMGGQCVCAGTKENSDGLCGDGIDNDCDGQTDCADPDCDLRRCMGNQMGMFCSTQKCTFGCLLTGTNNKPYFVADGTTPNAALPCLKCNAKVDDRQVTPLPDGSGCSVNNVAGSCHKQGTVCCTGCWSPNANSCFGGTSAAACGAAGHECASCVDGNGCTQDVCAAGKCSNPLAQAGTPCTGCGGGGQCRDGGCNGSDCVVTGVCNQGGGCDTNNPSKVTCCQQPARCRGGTNTAACGN